MEKQEKYDTNSPKCQIVAFNLIVGNLYALNHYFKMFILLITIITLTHWKQILPNLFLSRILAHCGTLASLFDHDIIAGFECRLQVQQNLMFLNRLSVITEAKMWFNFMSNLITVVEMGVLYLFWYTVVPLQLIWARILSCETLAILAVYCKDFLLQKVHRRT